MFIFLSGKGVGGDNNESCVPQFFSPQLGSSEIVLFGVKRVKEFQFNYLSLYIYGFLVSTCFAFSPTSEFST